jgi:arylsulfatase
VKSFKNPRIGEFLGRDEAPQVARKPLWISVEVEPQTRDGVIVAHGGSATGYALHLSDGKLVFTVRQRKQPVAITASETPAGRLAIQARLAADGAMTLVINGKQAAAGKSPGLFPVQPQEHFCIGFDDGQPVGDYGVENRFSGKIENLTVRAGTGP